LKSGPSTQEAVYPCPACSSPEFSEPPGSYGICSHCDWEDDGVQLANPTSRGGANRESLAEAQEEVLTKEPPPERHAAWRALAPNEIRFQQKKCEIMSTPWPNKATTTYYWTCSVESVITVTDFYDGPRGGIASFGGKPHIYQSRFNDMDDEYDDVFDLWELDDATFMLALEDWEIWLRWEEAFHAGQTAQDTHPALPQDRARHEELKTLLEGRLPPPTPPVTQRVGEFQQDLVRWSPVPTSDAEREDG